MYIFYRKHHAHDTPLWVHYLVLGGLALRGGRRMLREIMRSQRQQGAVEA